MIFKWNWWFSVLDSDLKIWRTDGSILVMMLQHSGKQIPCFETRIIHGEPAKKWYVPPLVFDWTRQCVHQWPQLWKFTKLLAYLSAWKHRAHACIAFIFMICWASRGQNLGRLNGGSSLQGQAKRGARPGQLILYARSIVWHMLEFSISCKVFQWISIDFYLSNFWKAGKVKPKCSPFQACSNLSQAWGPLNKLVPSLFQACSPCSKPVSTLEQAWN